MSKIKEALSELRRAPGVKGCGLVTSDGLMVAYDLDRGFREDVVAGLTSFLLSTTLRCLNDSNMGSMSSYMLHATHGKVVVMDLDGSFLVVILDQFADMELCRPEIRAVAQQLRRTAKMHG